MGDDRELKDQRIPIMMTETEVTAIDDWSFKNRIRSRGEAIRRLCQIGLVFDDHRKELVDKFRDIMESGTEIIDLSRRAAADPTSLTQYEKDLLSSGLNTLQLVVQIMPLVRTTTGIANNLKSDRNLDEIIREAKEILSIRDGSKEQ